MLYGWGGALLVIDQLNTQECFFDLVDFAKKQWNDMCNDHNFDGGRFSFEETATASDVPEFPMARSREITKGREGLRRDFDPVARPEKGKGKGKGKQDPSSSRQLSVGIVGSMATDPLIAPNVARGVSNSLGRAGHGRIEDGPGSNTEADGATPWRC